MNNIPVMPVAVPVFILLVQVDPGVVDADKANSNIPPIALSSSKI